MIASVRLVITMLPAPAAIVSSKVATRLASMATPAAPSAGAVVRSEGGVLSALVVKFHAVLPAMPGFYHQPSGIGDLVDFVVQRICDQLGMDVNISERWGS